MLHVNTLQIGLDIIDLIHDFHQETYLSIDHKEYSIIF